MDELSLTNPRALHALAHPVRLAILDLLGERAEANATECAAVVDASVQSCSYHLRTLAKWGLVEEADGPDGRERRWRMRVSGFSVSKEQQAASPQMAAAWAALRTRIVQRDLEILSRFLDEGESFTAEQHRASTIRNLTLEATPDELERLADEVSALLRRYERPARGHRAEGTERVHAVFWLVPRKGSVARDVIA